MKPISPELMAQIEREQKARARSRIGGLAGRLVKRGLVSEGYFGLLSQLTVRFNMV